MPSLRVEIRECGAVRDSAVELPEGGLAVVVGPGLGEGAVAEALGAIAAAGSATADGPLIGGFRERVKRRELSIDSAWVELDPREQGRNLLDPEPRIDTERDYFARTVLAAELCLPRWVNPWQPIGCDCRIKVSLSSELLGAEAALPAEGVEHVRVWGSDAVCGLNVGEPALLAARFVSLSAPAPSRGLPAPTPSALLARLLARTRPLLDCELVEGVKRVLAEPLRLGGAEAVDFDLAFTAGGEPALVLGDQVLACTSAPGSVRALLGNWLALTALAALRRECGGRWLLAGVVEPEEHLEPYAAYLLAHLYALAAGRLGATFVVATKSDAFLKGVEDAVFESVLPVGRVRVYEAAGTPAELTLRELKVREDGTVEGARFTKAAKVVVKRRLGQGG